MTTGRINQVSRLDKQSQRRRTCAGPESKASTLKQVSVKVNLVALGLPDNKQLSYPYKYNRSETRVLFTRRVKSTQKQYGNGGLQPKNPFRSQSPTYAVKSSGAV